MAQSHSFLPASHLPHYSNRQNEIHLTLDMWTLGAFVPENNIFSCSNSSIPTHKGLTEYSRFAFQSDPHGNAHPAGQIPPTFLHKVIWDQTTSNFLVFNLQIPHITSKLLMNNVRLLHVCHGHGWSWSWWS